MRSLKVQAGVPQPPSINPDYVRAPRSRQRATELLVRMVMGDRACLAEAISLIESTRRDDEVEAEALLDLALQSKNTSVRIGLTGVPGVGKSTLIDRIGMEWIEAGHRVAVLAVDPSSAATHGSILGDKSRMPNLAAHPRAFIRPSPGGTTLGGVAQRTREAITLCEAAGYDLILIETIGVGQGEYAVQRMCDCFVLLALAGAGDELQGIKRGIMELADIVAVTKADGPHLIAAENARSQVASALRILNHPVSAVCVSALTGAGVETLANEIVTFVELGRATGAFAQRRNEQAVYWMEDMVVEQMVQRALLSPAVLELRSRLVGDLVSGNLPVRKAARMLLDLANPDGPA